MKSAFLTFLLIFIALAVYAQQSPIQVAKLEELKGIGDIKLEGLKSDFKDLKKTGNYRNGCGELYISENAFREIYLSQDDTSKIRYLDVKKITYLFIQNKLYSFTVELKSEGDFNFLVNEMALRFGTAVEYSSNTRNWKAESFVFQTYHYGKMLVVYSLKMIPLCPPTHMEMRE